MQKSDSLLTLRIPRWTLALAPLALLVALVAAFLLLNPLAFFSGAFPPLEQLNVQRVTFPAEGEIRLELINGGPDPVTVAQVLVDDAYWQYTVTPGNTLDRLERATIDIPYPWVDGEPLAIKVVTATGLTFEEVVDVAVPRRALTGAPCSLMGCWASTWAWCRWRWACSGTPSCARWTASG